MRVLLTGLTGALTVAGLLLTVAGLRGADGPRWPHQPVARRPAGRRRGWQRWRWVVAGAAGASAWAITTWPVAGLLMAVAVLGVPVLLSTSGQSARRIARVEAIEEWTRRLADVLTAGSGLEQAIVSSARTCPAPLRSEVDTLLARLRARWPLTEALRGFADDLHDPAGDLVVAALLLAAHRRGPGLASVLTGVAASVGEDVAARRRIEAERARPRATARAVTLITLGVLAFGALNGSYLAPYGDPLGQVVLAVIAAGFVGCLAWMRHLTAPPDEPRLLGPRMERP